ncbi:hypothetical protein M3Y96_00613600 [Aphelenchoides besseyi]|nr:hypothetical protein M3Y96_00613600 [Aphelenchoides besseyi]
MNRAVNNRLINPYYPAFKIGDKLKIYKVEKESNEQVGIDVCVVKVNEALDFVLLKSESNVAEHGPSVARARESESFTLAGFDNTQGSLSYLPGTIHSGPFILGTHRSSRGDSGGDIWGSRGLIGMNVACTTMPLQFHRLAISEAANFSPKNTISSDFRFKEAYMEELDKERRKEKVASPPQKKPHYMVEFDGVSTSYGNLY